MKNLLLGCISSLEKRSGVIDVKFHSASSVSKHELSDWEQRNTCTLPDDVKAFYLTMDGFNLTWSSKLCDGITPLGRMEQNRLENVTRVQFANNKEVASVLDGIFDDEDDSNTPRFDSRSRMFELDPCEGNGKVCLVYLDTKPGVPAQESHIWFLDRAFNWHYLADTFTVYFRLMIAHIGLPQWQYSLTDVGLSPHVQQWFNIYAPLRMEMTIDTSSKPAPVDATECVTNQIDTQQVFKGKIEKKKVAASTSAPLGVKKKQLQSSVSPGSKTMTQRSSASSIQNTASKARP